MSQTGKKKPDAPQPEINWNTDMGGAPAGVTLKLKKPDGTIADCYFHATREMKGGRWQKTGYWTELYGPRRPLTWEPQGWVWP